MEDLGLPDRHEPGPEWDDLEWPTSRWDSRWSWLHEPDFTERVATIAWNIKKAELEKPAPPEATPKPKAYNHLPTTPCPNRGGVDVMSRRRAGLVRLAELGSCRRNTCGWCGPVAVAKTARAIGLHQVNLRLVLRPFQLTGPLATAGAFRSAIGSIVRIEMKLSPVAAAWVTDKSGDGSIEARVLVRGDARSHGLWTQNAHLHDLQMESWSGGSSDPYRDGKWLLFDALRAFDSHSDAAAAAIIKGHLDLNANRIIWSAGEFWRNQSGIRLKGLAEARAIVARNWQRAAR
jgi:hypothetical protein